MNSHKNARTIFAGRQLLISRIRLLGLMPTVEASALGWKGLVNAVILLNASPPPHFV